MTLSHPCPTPAKPRRITELPDRWTVSRICVVRAGGDLLRDLLRRSEDGAVRGNLERRSAARTELAGHGAPGGPGAAFEDAGERQLGGGLAEALTHGLGDAVEQRDGQRAPLDDDL